MSAQRGNPEPEELIAAGVASALLNLRVATIGIVKEYDAEEQTCSVEPAIKRPIETDDGDLSQEPDAIIPNVMVGHWGGSAITQHTVLAVGDVVLLVYLDYSPALWRERGSVSDTPDTHKHRYAVAVPFFRPGGGAGPDVDNSIGEPGGTRVHFESGVVRVGATTDPAAEFVAMAAKTNARLDALESFAASHTHATAGTGPPVPAAPPFTPGGGDVSATKLKTG